MKIVFCALMFGTIVAFSFASVSGQTKRRIHFAIGASRSTVTGIIRGYEYKDHVVRASAGQSLGARVRSQKSNPVMTIFLPNGKNLAGAAETDNFTGKLPVGGDYVIRVLLMRAEARRPYSTSNYSLQISIH